MFCVNCGAQVPESGSYCVACGTHVSRPAPTAPATATNPPGSTKCDWCGAVVDAAQTKCPQCQATIHREPGSIPAQAARPVVAAASPIVSTSRPSGTMACSWCGATIETGQGSCPKCGAALKLPSTVTPSGWAQLPARKDMAKLQFGNSFCQIEGAYVPVADMKLAAEDSIYFTHHVLLWKDPEVDVTTMSLRSGWKRLLAGMPLIMTQAQGPGHIAFSRDNPGELIPLPLQPGQSVDVREHLFLVATGNIAYDWIQTNIWFQTKSGNDTETHYPIGMYMDRFFSPKVPGLLLLHAAGNVFVRELGPSQTILVKPTALIFKDPSVRMELHFERPNPGNSWWTNHRYLWLRLSGPGRVAVQSVFERMEGEARNMTQSSYATERRW
jgi:uncharacterized protein (AIM24 family)/RNA polymerase subunit RPABC4/transcription elongation factor Spt4